MDQQQGQNLHGDILPNYTYLPGVFFFAAILMVNRLFFAVKKTTVPLITSTISLVITLPLYVILGDKFGVSGIAITSSAYSFISFALLLYSWKRIYPESRLHSLLIPIGQILLIGIFGGILAHYLSLISLPSLRIEIADKLLSLIFVTSIPFATVFIILDRIKVISLRSLIKKIIRR